MFEAFPAAGVKPTVGAEYQEAGNSWLRGGEVSVGSAVPQVAGNLGYRVAVSWGRGALGYGELFPELLQKSLYQARGISTCLVSMRSSSIPDIKKQKQTNKKKSWCLPSSPWMWTLCLCRQR